MGKAPIKVIRNFRGTKVNTPPVRGFSRADCEYYSRVPKTLKENLEWRRDLFDACNNDKARRDDVIKACRLEPLFWINAFCWTYDPRNSTGLEVIPFITFDCQDELVYEMFLALGYYDVLIEKSRDMGVSWCSLAVMQHQFQFEKNQQFAVASKKADLVDKTGYKDALFWKLQFLMKNQPGWMRPNYLHNEMILTNPAKDSIIIGETATGDIGRAGRNRAIFLDEFPSFKRDEGYCIEAATASNTNCRIFNGTSNGTGNAFFDVREGLDKGTRSGRLLRVHWAEDLRKNFGLYTSGSGYRKLYPGAPDHDYYEDDDLVLLTRSPNGKPSDEYDFDADYKHLLDGKIRSPWYDNEAKRYAHPMLLAQELDIDYHNSSFRFFDEQVIQGILSNQVVDPFLKGEFIFDADTDDYKGFEEREDGNWLLWIRLDTNGMPQRHLSFVNGVDISSGTGASNSAMSIADDVTGEKVAEYANPYISPEDFGRLGSNVFKVFNKCYYIWENNGPGRNFGKKLLEGGVDRFYHRKDDVSIKQKVSDIPGWASTKDRKYSLLSDYRDAQHKGDFTNPSYHAVKECREYINLPDNTVVHQAAKDPIDPTGAKSGHGDRVMADALAYKGVFELNRGKLSDSESDKEEERTAPEGTFGHRFDQSKLAAKEDESGWREDYEEWS